MTREERLYHIADVAIFKTLHERARRYDCIDIYRDLQDFYHDTLGDVYYILPYQLFEAIECQAITTKQYFKCCEMLHDLSEHQIHGCLIQVNLVKDEIQIESVEVWVNEWCRTITDAIIEGCKISNSLLCDFCLD